MHRNTIGIDIIPEYYDAVKKRFASVEYSLFGPEEIYESSESAI